MDILYPRCAGIDVHKDTVVAGVRLASDGPVRTEVRTFDTTTPGLLALSAWLAEQGCTHLAMEATGVYWRPVWHVRTDLGQRRARPQDRCRRRALACRPTGTA